MSNPLHHQRARVAALRRHRGPHDPEAVAAARDLAADSLAAHVARVVAQAPPLTPAQRDRIAALLRPAAAGTGAA
jgi:hypothetical protein